MVPDDTSIGKSNSSKTRKSPQVLAKEWQTVDKFTWLNRIRRLPLNASQKHLLHAMAVYANPDGSNVFAAIKTLAADMSMDRKTVNGHVIKLRDAGWLIAEGRVSTFNRTVQYRINIDKILSVDAENKDVGQKDRGVTPLPKEELSPNRMRRDASIESNNTSPVESGNNAPIERGVNNPIESGDNTSMEGGVNAPVESGVNPSVEGGVDTSAERGMESLPAEAQRRTTRSSYQTNQTKSEVPDHHHQAAPDDDGNNLREMLEALYFSWREKSITKGVLKVLMSEEATVEYWKARLAPGQGKQVKNPSAYLRKCLENDPPAEFEPPVASHKQYTTGEWADYIES